MHLTARRRYSASFFQFSNHFAFLYFTNAVRLFNWNFADKWYWNMVRSTVLKRQMFNVSKKPFQISKWILIADNFIHVLYISCCNIAVQSCYFIILCQHVLSCMNNAVDISRSGCRSNNVVSNTVPVHQVGMTSLF